MRMCVSTPTRRRARPVCLIPSGPPVYLTRLSPPPVYLLLQPLQIQSLSHAPVFLPKPFENFRFRTASITHRLAPTESRLSVRPPSVRLRCPESKLTNAKRVRARCAGAGRAVREGPA
eukprot:9004713-Pyramimonas_sp.AAC.1